MFWKPPIVVVPSRRAGRSPADFVCLISSSSYYNDRGVEAHELVGLNAVSELAISTHSPRGTVFVRYAIAARHCGSMDGREKAGPHM
jgi:hypothetical protein